MKRLVLLIVLLWVGIVPGFSQRTDLTGLKFCIDPGHGGHNDDDRHVIPDPGVDFWESESNFQKALLLKSLLEQEGAWVVLTRTSNDTTYPGGDDEPSLAARVQLANDNGVDWFHSIHSNAFNGQTNYTLVLVREKRSLTDPAASTGNGLGVPERQESWDISSNFISPGIYGKLRTQQYVTYLDWTFYGGVNGGFSLGVLRGLLMPGELSEGSFHDVLPETRRLMNNDYRKMEAYAIRNAFMQYFAVPPDTTSIIAGLQRNLSSQAPLNYSQVRLLPEGRTYTGDQYNNGFYLFDHVAHGPHLVRFETPGFAPDSIQVNVGRGVTTFVDRALVALGYPVVLNSTPANNDTAFPASQPVRLVFSTIMDTASVRKAFTIAPNVAGSIVWSNANTTGSFVPTALFPMYENFTVTIDTSARSATGSPLDGNGDGIPGDPYVLHFKTTFADVTPPALVARYPDSAQTVASPSNLVSMTFDESIDPATVNTTNIAVQRIGGALLGRTFQTFQANGRSGITMYPIGGLVAGMSYRVRVNGVKDMYGNAIPAASPLIWSFSVYSGSYAYTTFDSLDGPTLGWTSPSADPHSTGLDSATFRFTPLFSVPSVIGDMGSAVLSYAWNQGARSWLLAESLDSLHTLVQPQWQKNGAVVRAYVLGDGSGTLFRFVIDDSVEAFPSGDPAHQEVSTWKAINWIGWKMVEWDLENDTVGSWTGNGLIEGQLRFRGFHLIYVPGSSNIAGSLVIDQIELAQRQPVSVPAVGTTQPTSFTLSAAFPNPFNPSTQIRYTIPVAGHVSLTIYDILGREIVPLVDMHQIGGKYEATWNGINQEGIPVASGVYFARLHVIPPGPGGGYSRTIKLLLTR